jgi:CheY-like chemotaxis protein
MKVLLVDDSPIVREATRSLLTSIGLHVTDCSGGKDALTRLSEEDFHAVLLDVEMPEMDGLQTLAEIRRRPGLADLPVIAMTGHAGVGDRERFLKAGMNDYVAKPVDQAEVARVLGTWLPGGLPQP